MNFRYIMHDRLGIIQVNPMGEADFTIEHKAPESGKSSYTKELPSKIIFTGDTFLRLAKIEKSIYRCDYVYITVEQKCVDGVDVNWLPRFTGRMSLNDGNWDYDRCRLEITLDNEKPDQCFEDNKTTEVNLLNVLFERKTVLTLPANIEIEKVTYSSELSGQSRCNGRYWGGTGEPEDGGWDTYGDKITIVSDVMEPTQTCITETKWARQVITMLASNPDPGGAWVFLGFEEIGLETYKKYARPAQTYGCVVTLTDNNIPGQQANYESVCSIVGDSANIFSIDNGLLLSDILEYFVSQFCPSLTVKSNFFQINPDVITDINYVTNAPSKVKHIMFFQKSDVKRPNSTQNASIGKINFEKLMLAITEIWHLEWRVEDGFLKIEHPIFWEKNQGIDLMQPRYADRVAMKNGYSYDNAEVPNREVYTFMEAQLGDFQGLPIIYTGGCVSKSSKGNIKTHALDFITTDVQLCLSNPSSDSKVVSDEGFVIIACDFDGENYSIISEAPVIDGRSTLNNSLAWAQLHRDYHKYKRALRYGIMNGYATTFLSVIPTKKGSKITIPFCCDDEFNPDDYVTGPFGNGTVSSAVFSFKNSTLELELLYPPDDGLETNAAPVAYGFNKTTYKNIPVEMPILPHITDADPDSVIMAIEIATPPMHGTAEILPGMIIRYTPDLDYSGDDLIIFRALDNWSEPTNNALIVLVIYPENQPPIANGAEFVTDQDTVLNEDAPGIFVNDEDDVAFSLDSYDAVSANGGDVLVNPDGSFTYTPPVGFSGVDTFGYTIIDEELLTASGTITITVRNPDNPVTVVKGYNAVIDQVLSESAPGVLRFDSTTVGVLTAVAETVATDEGGSVVISTDGSFVYTPPAGFTGEDGFDYTAENGIGSMAGRVHLNVLPVIYLRMLKINDTYNPLPDTPCEDTLDGFNYSRTATYRFYFYSDGAGVTPMDVTGLGLLVSVHEERSIVITTPDDTYPSVIDTDADRLADGSQFDFYTNEAYQQLTQTCGGGNVYVSSIYTVNPGTYTIL